MCHGEWGRAVCLLSAGRPLPHRCTVKRPLLVTWIQERPQQPGPSGPWCTTAPSVPLMREVAPLSPRSPASHPPTQRPLLWPPFSVSLWFSKGSRLCPEAEREAGVLEAWEPLFSVSCGQRGAQEGGSHSPRGVYPGGTQSHGGTQEVVWGHRADLRGRKRTLGPVGAESCGHLELQMGRE